MFEAQTLVVIDFLVVLLLPSFEPPLPTVDDGHGTGKLGLLSDVSLDTPDTQSTLSATAENKLKYVLWYAIIQTGALLNSNFYQLVG